MTTNKKFKELVEQLEKQTPPPKPVMPEPPKKKKIPPPPEGLFKIIVDNIEPFEAVVPAKQEISMSAKVAASKASELYTAKIKQANAQAIVIMPPALTTDWLVQVFPDESGVLHFQAKSSTMAHSYTRWYEVVVPEVYAKVEELYQKTDGSSMRPSFYGSDKMYMICKRLDAITVEIPGYGPHKIPALFAK